MENSGNIPTDKTNHKENVKRILEIDFISRKYHSWPLIPIENWNKYSLLDVIGEESEEREDDCLIITHRDARYDSPSFDFERFYRKFPYAQQLLEKFHGKLAICGGFFTPKTISESDWGVTDIDFFFHSCTQEEAESILKAAVTEIVDRFNKEDGRKERIIYPPYTRYSSSNTITIEHRLHVTNVSVITARIDIENASESMVSKIIKYQFIHRLYPNLGSILGGFDLGPSMVAYDGKNIWATEMGAWTHANSTMIVDISRRSTTFAKRIIKYYRRGFDVVFPGLRQKTQYFSDLNYSQRLAVLKESMDSIGIKFRCRENDDYIYDYEENRESIWYEHFSNLNFFMINDLYFFSFYGDSTKNENIQLGPKYAPKREDKEQLRKEQSDYGDWTFGELNKLAAMNKSLLINDNLDPVTAVIIDKPLKGKSLKQIEGFYNYMLMDPFIPVISATKHQRLKEENGKFNSEYMCRDVAEFPSNDEDDYYEVLDERIEKNLEKCRNNLKGVTWITKNPGRQWTSSINPEVIDAAEYYGKFYVPFRIGIDHEVETLLRLMRKTPGNVWYTMPKDVFNLIIKTTILVNS